MAELKKVSVDYDVELVDDDITRWRVSIPGPEGSPYEEGVFLTEFAFPQGYPFSPPDVTFLTKIYHPNVTLTGTICLGVLKSTEWKPTFTAHTVANAIHDLLFEPDFHDALVPELVKIYAEDRGRYMKQARTWTQKYAAGEDGD